MIFESLHMKIVIDKAEQAIIHRSRTVLKMHCGRGTFDPSCYPNVVFLRARAMLEDRMVHKTGATPGVNSLKVTPQCANN